MSILLGGRAAEHLIFGHLSTCAADDLSKATEIARSMITRYGMSAVLGHAVYEHEPRGYLDGAQSLGRRYSEETAREIDTEAEALVKSAFERARAFLDANRDLLEESARRLLAQETLAEKDLADLFKKLPRSNAASSIAT
jgi:cell division protease FtsH